MIMQPVTLRKVRSKDKSCVDLVAGKAGAIAPVLFFWSKNHFRI